MEVGKKQSGKIEIRDSRRRQMYRIDDDYLNGYARLCGVNATAVYNSLCRHADTNQESWPSIERIMDQHGLSKPTVIKAIKQLEKWGIVSVVREKNQKTKRQMVNVYVLVDKSQWKTKPGKGDLPSPSKESLPGAGLNKLTEPGKKNSKKPGKPNLPEGYTEEKDTQRRIVADATDTPVTNTCKTDGCSNDPIKDRDHCKIHQTLDCAGFVEWYRKSAKRYIRLIAELADEVKPTFETVAQWEVWAAQHYRAAQTLEPFTDSQIADAFEKVKNSPYITEFNLYTVIKFLTNTSKK